MNNVVNCGRCGSTYVLPHVRVLSECPRCVRVRR